MWKPCETVAVAYENVISAVRKPCFFNPAEFAFSRPSTAHSSVTILVYLTLALEQIDPCDVPEALRCVSSHSKDVGFVIRC